MTLAAIELGGTKTLVSVGRDPAHHSPPVHLSTAAPKATLQAAIAALKASEGSGAPITAIGVASFGPLQLDPAAADYGRYLATPKAGWAGAELLAPLREAFDVPIALDTDVNAAAVGEGRWGAAAGLEDHAYITVGTGVGVGVVSNGRPVHGAGHPEGGHLPVRTRADDQFAGACPWHGRCVEGLISGPAIQARLGRPGAHIAADDPVWDLSGDYLAQLCAALVLLNAPRRVVIGGGVGRRTELLAAVRRHLGVYLNGYLPRLASRAAISALVVPAALENAGLMGAFHLAAAKIK